MPASTHSHTNHTTMQTAVLTPERQWSVQQQPIPACPEGGALVRVLGCGICGSDLEKWLLRPIDAPVVLGHEVVGVIDTLSESAQNEFPHLAVGQRVALAHHASCMACYYCLHDAPSMCRAFKSSNLDPGGFCQVLAVTGAHLAHTVFPMAEGLSDAAASCVEPLGCCLRAIDRFPEHTESVAMLGLGFIGLMSSQVLSRQGKQVFGIDLQPQRVELARQHEWVTQASSNAKEFETQIFDATDARGVDAVFLSVVNSGTVKLALSVVRDGGTLLLFAAPTDAVMVDPAPLYFKELQVRSSYSPSMEHLRQAAEMINTSNIDCDPLMTHTVPLALIDEGFECYKTGKAIKVFVQS